MAEVALEDLIDSLRRDLQAAERKGEGKDLRFGVEKVEIELSVEIRRDKELEGGVKLYVVDLGGEGARGRTDRQTVSLSLTLHRSGGAKLRIGDETVQVEPG